MNTSQSPSGLLLARDRKRYSASFGELGRIAEQVEEVLTQLGLVRMHRSQVALEILHEGVAVLVDQRRDGRLHVAEQLGHIEGFEEQLHPVGLDLRQVEDVVDEREEMAAGAGDLLQFRDEPVPLLVGRLLDQHLAVADDRVQRCTQLMAHRREEAAFGFVGRFGIALGPLQIGLSELEFGDVGIDGDGAAVGGSAFADANPSLAEPPFAHEARRIPVDAQALGHPVLRPLALEVHLPACQASLQDVLEALPDQLASLLVGEDLAILAVGKQDPVFGVV